MNTVRFGKLNEFSIQMGKTGAFHLRTHRAKMVYYLCNWSIRNFSTCQNVSTKGFQETNSCFKCNINLSVYQHVVKIVVESVNHSNFALKRGVTLSTDSGTVLFHTTFYNKVSYGCTDNVYLKNEDFNKLKQLPNDTLVLTCRIIRYGVDNPSLNHHYLNAAINNSEYLKTLEADLKKYSGAFSKQKVNFRVGEETIVVNKAVLCARSPVFAKMFEADMREGNVKTVTITDIKMPVLKTLVSYLYSGFLPDCQFDFLCYLYCAAKKYGITELYQTCIKFLSDKITEKNIIPVLKMSLSNSDELLKSLAMTVISANIEPIVLTADWNTLMQDDPEIALKASGFFDF